MRSPFLPIAFLLTALLSGGAALAQTIDYGELEALFGEKVTTSATGKPQKESEVPIDMEIISADDIRRTGATDLPDILANYAGVNIKRSSLGSADIGIRGYNTGLNARLLVLVNGRQVYLDQFGYTQWNALPVQLSEIRQIEIVRGPNSALFGFNAASGVINIITYDPMRDDVGIAEIRGGTQAYKEGGAVATVRQDGFGFRLSGGGDSARDFHDDARLTQRNEFQNKVSPDSGKINLDMRGKILPNVELGLEASAVNSAENNLVPQNYYSAVTERIRSIKGNVAASTDFGILSADIYTNLLDERSFLDITSGNNPAIRLDYRQQVTVAQLSDLFQIGGAHSFRLSGEYRRNDVNTSPLPGGNVGYDVFAGGGMWDWRISKSFSLTNAVRADHLMLDRSGTTIAGLGITNDDYNRRAITAFTYNSGAVYKVSAADTVTLTAGRGMQLPSLLGFGALLLPAFNTSGAVVGVQTGLPSLQPVRVDNYELAFAHDFTELDANAKLAAFYQINRNMLTGNPAGVALATTPYVIQAAFLNNANSHAMGLELSGAGKLSSSWHWQANSSFILLDDSNENMGTAPIPGRVGIYSFDQSTPFATVSLGFGYAAGPWEADLRGRFTSGYRTFRNTGYGQGLQVQGIDNHVVLGGRVAYAVTDALTLAASGEQLNANRETLNTGLRSERRAYLTATLRY